MNSVSGGGADAIEVRDKSSANRGVGEMAFHRSEFALGGVFSLVKLDTLAFYRLKLILMRLISINISDNTRIFEVYNGVVDEESGSG